MNPSEYICEDCNQPAVRSSDNSIGYYPQDLDVPMRGFTYHPIDEDATKSMPAESYRRAFGDEDQDQTIPNSERSTTARKYGPQYLGNDYLCSTTDCTDDAIERVGGYCPTCRGKRVNIVLFSQVNHQLTYLKERNAHSTPTRTKLGK